MRIVKKGVLPEDHVYSCTCRNCQTVFEFQQKDGRVVHDQRDGNAVVVQCPLCKNECWVAI